MSIKQQRQRRKLVHEINALRTRRDALIHDITILKAYLLTGNKEKSRRVCDKKQDFFPALVPKDVQH